MVFKQFLNQHQQRPADEDRQPETGLFRQPFVEDQIREQDRDKDAELVGATTLAGPS